jgi:transglutaminase-like putative cysteine protease
MKNIIPGFRTKNTFKKILACVGYVIMFIIAYVLIYGPMHGSDPYALTLHDKLISRNANIDIFIFIIIIPFMLITNFIGIHEKLPLFKRSKILSIIALVIIFNLSLSSIRSKFSSDYITTQNIADAKQKVAYDLAKQQDAAKKLKKELANTQINTDLRTTVSSGDNFSLPSTIVAIVNSSNKVLPITWDKPSNINTSTVGIKTFVGRVNGYDKSINYTVTVLPNPTVYGLDSISTQNSMVKYSVNFGRYTKWVWFKISKNEESEDQYARVVNGVMNYNLYLHFGQGLYQIDVLTSSNINENSYYYELGNFTINNQDKRDMRYLMPSKYVQSDSPEIISLANNITKDCYSDMEKTKAIHDWVSSNISYDVKAFNSGTILEYSSLDTLHDKTAVCNGYANLTAALNRAIGIKTKVCSGTATTSTKTGGFFGIGAKTTSSSAGHAWNETYVSNRWVIQDTTWDAGGVDASGNFIPQLSED